MNQKSSNYQQLVQVSRASQAPEAPHYGVRACHTSAATELLCVKNQPSFFLCVPTPTWMVPAGGNRAGGAPGVAPDEPQTRCLPALPAFLLSISWHQQCWRRCRPRRSTALQAGGVAPWIQLQTVPRASGLGWDEQLERGRQRGLEAACKATSNAARNTQKLQEAFVSHSPTTMAPTWFCTFLFPPPLFS